MEMKRRRKLTRDQWSEIQARSETTLRTLQERIDHHRASLREKYGPHYQPSTLEERIAYHQARLKEPEG